MSLYSYPAIYQCHGEGREEGADRRQAQQDQSSHVARGEKRLTLFNQLSYRQPDKPQQWLPYQTETDILGFTDDDST